MTTFKDKTPSCWHTRLPYSAAARPRRFICTIITAVFPGSLRYHHLGWSCISAIGGKVKYPEKVFPEWSPIQSLLSTVLVAMENFHQWCLILQNRINMLLVQSASTKPNIISGDAVTVCALNCHKTTRTCTVGNFRRTLVSRFQR